MPPSSVVPNMTVSLTGVWAVMVTPAGSAKAAAVANTVLVASVGFAGAGMLTDQAPFENTADSCVNALLNVMVEGGRLTGVPLETVTIAPSM